MIMDRRNIGVNILVGNNNNNNNALRRQLLPRSSERKRFTISEGSSVSTTRGSKVEVAWIGSFIGSFM